MLACYYLLFSTITIPITFSFQAATPKPTFVEKPVKGAKNGETRMVRVKRLRNDVPTTEK